eukprot:2379394-Pyramimonas_sp.AAC.1
MKIDSELVMMTIFPRRQDHQNMVYNETRFEVIRRREPTVSRCPTWARLPGGCSEGPPAQRVASSVEMLAEIFGRFFFG